jgi:hypothetical protein
VTTIRANFVGSAAVSAITQTPASGPFGPVTTPEMSSGSAGIAVETFCCVGAWPAAWIAAMARARMDAHAHAVLFMLGSS